MNPDSQAVSDNKTKKLPLIPLEDFINSLSLTLPLDQTNPVLCHDLYINGPTDCTQRKKLIKSFSKSIIKNPPPPKTEFRFTYQEEGEKISDNEFKRMLEPFIKEYAKVSPELKIYLDNNMISDKGIGFLVKHMGKPHKTPEVFFLGLSNNNITIKAGEKLYQALINNPNLCCELPDLLVKSDQISEEERANEVAKEIIRLSNRNTNFFHLEKGLDEIGKQLDELYYQKRSEVNYEEKCLQATRKLIELKTEDYHTILTQQDEQKNKLSSMKKGKDKQTEQRRIAIQSDYINKIGSKIAEVEEKIYRAPPTLPMIDSCNIHSRISSRELFSTLFISHNPPEQQIESNKNKLGTLGREVIAKLDERLKEIKQERLTNVNEINGPIKTHRHEASTKAATSLEERASSGAFFVQESQRTNPLAAPVGSSSIFNKQASLLGCAKETANGGHPPQPFFTQEWRANPLGLFSITAVITTNTSTNNDPETEENQSSQSRLKINI